MRKILYLVVKPLLALILFALMAMGVAAGKKASLVSVQTIDAPHLQVALEQSSLTGTPGSHITLVTELRLPADVHVYAPGAKGYKPLKLELDPMPEMEFMPAIYPQSKDLYLAVIDEHIAVFDGTFRVSQEVKVKSDKDFSASLGKDGKMVIVTGKLDYQVCDNTMCYLPSSIPVKWQVQVNPGHARVRSDILHASGACVCPLLHRERDALLTASGCRRHCRLSSNKPLFFHTNELACRGVDGDR